MEFYAQRTANSSLVKCLGAEKEGEGAVKVITELILMRWKDHMIMSFEEIEYALREALRGFKMLSEKFGPFTITHRMIGFNVSGNVKVWMNENFAVNRPQSPK